MARHRRMLLFSMMGIILVAVLLYLRFPTQPQYRGQGVEFWIAQLEMGEFADAKAKSDATTALRSMGDAAVTYLVTVLRKKDSRLKRTINRLSNESLLGRDLFPSAQSQKGWAAHALGEIGPPAI